MITEINGTRANTDLAAILRDIAKLPIAQRRPAQSVEPILRDIRKAWNSSAVVKVK